LAVLIDYSWFSTFTLHKRWNNTTVILELFLFTTV